MSNQSAPQQTKFNDSSQLEDDNNNPHISEDLISKRINDILVEKNCPPLHADQPHLTLKQAANLIIHAFDSSPYINYTGIDLRFENQTIVSYLENRHEFTGNLRFKILHGGVAATVLDTIGGSVAMLEIYRRHQGDLQDQVKKITRLATVDLRIDYIAPGRGKKFISTAKVIKMGRKGCTMQMEMVNEQDKLIAMGMGSYTF